MEGGSKSAVKAPCGAGAADHRRRHRARRRLDLDRRGHHQLDQRLYLFWLQPGRHQHRRHQHLVNAAKATFDDQNTAGWEIIQYTGTGIFDNAGLFDKTVASGASTTTVSTVFNNQSTGTVKVDAGTLSLTEGGTRDQCVHRGGRRRRWNLTAGSFALNNASAISSSGTLRSAAAGRRWPGTLGEAATLEITAGGTLTAARTITAASFSQSGGSAWPTPAPAVKRHLVLERRRHMEGGSTSTVQGALVAQGPLIIAGSTAALDVRLDPGRRGHHQLDQQLRVQHGWPVGTSISGANTHEDRASKATASTTRTPPGYEDHPVHRHRDLRQCRAVRRDQRQGRQHVTVSTVFNSQSTGTFKVDAGTLSLTGKPPRPGRSSWRPAPRAGI